MPNPRECEYRLHPFARGVGVKGLVIVVRLSRDAREIK